MEHDTAASVIFMWVVAGFLLMRYGALGSRLYGTAHVMLAAWSFYLPLAVVLTLWLLGGLFSMEGFHRTGSLLQLIGALLVYGGLAQRSGYLDPRSLRERAKQHMERLWSGRTPVGASLELRSAIEENTALPFSVYLTGGRTVEERLDTLEKNQDALRVQLRDAMEQADAACRRRKRLLNHDISILRQELKGTHTKLEADTAHTLRYETCGFLLFVIGLALSAL
ncbi:MAG: hypothetical protein AAFY29_03175 [Pseudomonadota bacterium]